MNHEELRKLINEDLKIDFSSLETEWQKQALIYYKWSELWTEARHELNELKIKLSNIEAALYVDIKVNYANYNYKSAPTESAIKSIVIQDKDYIDTRAKIASLTVKTELLSSAVRALEHKKSALENINTKSAAV